MKKETKTPAVPVMSPEMARWAVQKLDVEIVGLNNHAERNRFAAFINKLIEIANHEEE